MIDEASRIECEKMYIRIVNEINAIVCEWQWFKVAYFDMDRARLWYEHVPQTFHILARAIQRDITLMIVRLMDKPSRTNKKKNVSIQQLLFDLYGSRSEFPLKIEALLEETEAECKKYLPHRHKQIAHLDLSTAVEGPKFELPELSSVDNVIRAYQNMLNAVASSNGWISYEAVIDNNAVDIECEWLDFIRCNSIASAN